jgi:hypothetical protein
MVPGHFLGNSGGRIENALKAVWRLPFILSVGNIPLISGHESILDGETIKIQKFTAFNLTSDAHIKVTKWLR